MENKQIEEMAKVTMKHCKIDNQCGSCNWSTCNECLADVLYNAGYRKAPEVVREIFEKVDEITYRYLNDADYSGGDMIYDLAELTEENERLLARNFDLAEKGEKVVIEYKKLSEENERLNKTLEQCVDDGEYWEGKYNNAKAETVWKMHSEIKERCIKGGIYPAFVASVIDQVAKEVLEGE